MYNEPVESSSPLTDAEHLGVYHDALAVFAGFRRATDTIAGESHLVKQGKKASESVVLNIAEGAGEFSPAEKARFYRIARRSATECAAVIDMLHVVSGDERLAEVRKNLVEVIRQLVGLIKYQRGRAEGGKGRGRGKGRGTGKGRGKGKGKGRGRG